MSPSVEGLDLAYASRPSPDERPPEGESGAAFGDRLFGFLDGGALLTPIPVEDRLLDFMLRVDGRAQTLAQVLTLPPRSASWSLTPAVGDRGERDFVMEALTAPPEQDGMSTPFELVLAQMTNAMCYRRAYFERCYRVTDAGRVVFDKIAYRPPSSCQLRFDLETGERIGFRQRTYKGSTGGVFEFEMVDIGPQKAFVYVHGQHRRPLTGYSVLETPYSIFELRQKVRFLWFSYLENQSMPKALAKHDTNDPKEAASFARRVASLKGNGVLGLLPDQEVEKFESSGNGADQYAAAMQFLGREMAQSALAGFVDLTSGTGPGSYALSKDSTDFFLQSCMYVLKEMAAAINQGLVADLCRYNFGKGAAVPVFKFGPLVQEVTTMAVEMLQALAVAPTAGGILPQAFIDQLIERVAAYLNLDTSVVGEAIKSRSESRGTPAGQLEAGAQAAAQLVASAGFQRTPNVTPPVSNGNGVAPRGALA